MVFLSKRVTMKNESVNKNNNNSLSEIINNISKSIVASPGDRSNIFRPAFNISGEQHKNVILSDNYNVGPGSYNNSLSLKVKPSASSFDNLNFNSSCPRFIYKNVEETPGPCSYYVENKFKTKNNNGNNMVNAILKTNEKQKLLSKGSTLISSIPSKSQKYGYFEGKDGELIKAEDPNLPLQFSGDKEDAVGPGSYDPKINSKQNKSVISWDKMSNRNLNCDFNESSTNYTKNNSAINGGGFNNSVNESKALTPKLSINNSKYNPISKLLI